MRFLSDMNADTWTCVARIIGRHNRPRSGRSIANALGRNPQGVWHTLRSLKDQGKIRQLDDGSWVRA